MVMMNVNIIFSKNYSSKKEELFRVYPKLGNEKRCITLPTSTAAAETVQESRKNLQKLARPSFCGIVRQNFSSKKNNINLQ